MNSSEIVKQAISTATQVPQELSSLLDELIRIEPKNFLEIGTDRGGTFRAFGLIAKPDGLKISLDIPRMKFWRGFDFSKLHQDMVKWFPGVHLIHANSHVPETLTLVNGILNGKQLDFLFIDGDHSYNGVKQDFEMYSPLVRPGGLIAFHDIVESEKHRRQNCYVASFWSELQGNKREYIFDGSWGGIGILEKPQAT